MGIFSKKPPPGPLPTLTVHLHTPADKVFKPNDTVSGYVTLVTPIPINPQAVEISFWGMSRVWLRTSSSNSTSKSTDYTHYRDNAPLFDICFNALANQQPQPQGQQDQKNDSFEKGDKGSEKEMEKGNGKGKGKELDTYHPQQDPQNPPSHQQPNPLLLPNQTYTYPFSFRVPEGTGFNRTGYYKTDTDPRFTILPHNLPPTMLSGRSKDESDNAHIEYGLTTRLLCPGISPSPSPTSKPQEPISATAEILFAPLNPHAHAPETVVKYDKPFTLSSSTLAGVDAKTIGFRQSLKDRFSKETPRLDFQLSIEVPDYLASGTEFRFRVSFTALERTPNVVAVPSPVTFEVRKLELLDFTFIRAPRDAEASNSMSGWRYKNVPTTAPQGLYSGGESERYREEKTLLNSLPAGPQVVALEEVSTAGMGEKDGKGVRQAESCAVWFTARVPGTTPPSFKSFAITRTYRLKVSVGVEVGGKKFESKIEGVVNALGSAV